jgi:hypothetical protein
VTDGRYRGDDDVDEAIRARFAELKAYDRQQLPIFADVVARGGKTTSHRPISVLRVVGFITPLAAAAMFLVVCGSQALFQAGSPATAPSPGAAAGDDRPEQRPRVAAAPLPLDFLLDVPERAAHLVPGSTMDRW